MVIHLYFLIYIYRCFSYYMYLTIFTARKRMFAKVMFLQLSVILLTGLGVRGCSGGGGMCGCSRGHAWLLWGGHVWLLRGACVVALGCVCGCSGGDAWLLRGHVWLLGGHAWLLWGGMHGCSGGACMVAPKGGTCMGYDEIRRYGQ